MKKLVLPLAILAAICLIGIAAAPADAGCGHYGGGYGYSSHSPSYSVGYGGGHTWHNTSHLDWHPGSYQAHGNHFDYGPGHYDVHHTGHWDHLHW